MTITASGAGASTIYYTLDGSDPTVSATRRNYTSGANSGPFVLNTSTQVNAVEQASGGAYGPISTVFLDIDPGLAPILQPGLILRLRGDFGILTSAGNPTPVSKWVDLSGHYNSFTGNSGSQPKLITNAINQLPAVNFDGTSQYLGFNNTNTCAITISGAPPSASGAQTVKVNNSTASYTAGTSDTNNSIASNLTTQINGLGISGVSASCASGSNVIQVTAPAATAFSGTPANNIQMGFQNIGFANFLIAYVAVTNAPPTGSSTQSITIAGHTANYSSTTADTNQSIAQGLATAINSLGVTGITASVNNNIVQIMAPLASTVSTSTSSGIVMIAQNSGATLFVVSSPNSSGTTAGARLFDFGQAASGNNILAQIASSGPALGQYKSYNGTSGSTASSASNLTLNQYQILGALHVPGATNANATVYLNGAPGSASTVNNIANVLRANSFVAQASSAGNYFPGGICELLLYGAQLTSSQISDITVALAQKYQLLTQTPQAIPLTPSLTNQVPSPPVFSLPGGILTAPVQVTIKTQPGSKTFITSDGTIPTQNSQAYCGCPIMINYDQTLKAMSVMNGNQSSVVSNHYVLDSTLWPPPSSSSPALQQLNLPTATH